MTTLMLSEEARPELYISASALRVLESCPREWFYRYIEGRRRQDIPARMVLGSAVHRAIQAHYRALHQRQPVPTLEDLVGIAAASITSAGLGDIPVLFEDGQDLQGLIREATRLLEVFVARAYRPELVIAVEAPFTIELVHPETGEVLPFEEKLVGQLDLVVEDQDGMFAVVDHKVSARLDSQRAERPDLQMSLYGWAASQLLQTPGVRLLYQQVIRTKVARIEVQEIQRVPHDEAEAIEAVASGLELIHLAVQHPEGKRLMGRRRSWRCRDCGFRDRCQEDRT